MKTLSFKVNGQTMETEVDPDTPLLYVLRDNFGMKGPRFGCGLGQCGACTVIIDESAVRSCVVPAASVEEAAITTLEGLGSSSEPHPVQKAFIDEQAAQCGYCINGMIMTAKAYLDKHPDPSEADVREALANNLCRCGTHPRIVAAVMRAAQEA